GLTHDQVIGRTCQDVFTQYFYSNELPCLYSHERCPLKQTIETGESTSIIRKVRDANGAEKWEDRVFSPILDKDGNVIYVMESVRDVTRFKNLEKMYSGMQELLHRVVHSSASAIVAANIKGKIILFNQAAENLFGYAANEADSINIRDVYPPGMAKEIMKMLRNEHIGGPGKLHLTQATIIRKNGEKIPVEMTAAIIYEDNQEVASMGIFNDLRERLAVEKKLQEAQAQLMQSEKLASLGRLAAGVAHEINNPLTSILLFGNIMLERLEKDNPQAKSLKYVLEDAQRCRDIIKGLLAYSRQSSPSKTVFAVNSLVEESFNLIRDQKMFMNVQVVRELCQEAIYINADKNQLSQVLINLIINAIDAMENEGELTCRTFVDPKTNKACIEISDTGCGILEANLGKVFDPFFTTKEPGKGTGLGLSMAYGIVNENRGRIFIKETGPKGTTFRLEMPQALPGDDQMPANGKIEEIQ
ncbi:MAG: PAS domain S-box protein, partial [Desulfatibacillaceae bacterium]|nr:PAS domain S-box protein [Desulfatibacillaceae bacterium]